MMQDAAIERVAVVGAGLVGIGWAIVFARAGLSVSLFDSDPSRVGAAKSDAALKLKDMERYGLVDAVEPIVDRISPCRSLEDAVGAAAYVQESVFEAVDVKRAGAEPARHWRRPAAVVALSPPPAMPGLIDASGWSEVDVPSLCVTGTADVMPRFVSDWRERCRSYEAAMRAPAYALIFRGMDHYFNGAFGRLAGLVDPTPVAVLQGHCAAFVQGVLANRPPDPERWRAYTSREVTALAHLCS